MQTGPACEALRTGKRATIVYDGFTRSVEVHAVGHTKDGNAVMRVFQVSGGSPSGKEFDWKLLRLDQVQGFAISDEASSAPRDGYKRGDKAMARIICQV